MSHAKYGNTIPEFVRRFREEQGLTQLELAEAMGVTATYVSNVENARMNNPVVFCTRLLAHVEPHRKKYLMDLIEQSNDQWLSRKLEA